MVSQPISPLIQQEGNGTVLEIEKNAQGRYPSYASLVNLEEGKAVEFIPVSEMNGVKFAKFVMEDIEEEVSHWQNAGVCYVLGVNPPLRLLRDL